ncbi:MAG: pyridoxamine 5'-phosphate oxidase family protein, partial [Mesorhizobium sp.]
MEFLTTRDELRAIYKTPRPTDGPIRKELKALDGHCRSFIGKSPFVLIGSS